MTKKTFDVGIPVSADSPLHFGATPAKAAFDRLSGSAAEVAAIAADPIEAAARAICEADPLSPAPDAPIMWKGKQAKAWEPRAEILREAVKAGLFCHPAKAWIAPWHPTDEMFEAAETTLARWGGIMGDEREEFYEDEDLSKLWGPIRDAHLKEEQAGPID